jgi:hypothetical protein
MSSQQNPEFSLIGESSTFTRIPSKDGELLEVKLHTKARTPVGVGHESIRTVVLGPDQSSAILAGLQMLHSQVQAIISVEVSRHAEAGSAQDPAAEAVQPSNA